MNGIQLNYIYQNSIFIITILALVCFLTLQLRKVKQADAKAERSAAFSRDIVLAQERERSRIARELHDTVIPEVRRIGFLSQGMQFQGSEIEGVCDTLILSIREICQNLIPPDFNLLGLGESLKNLCIAFETKSGIECRPMIPDNLNLGALGPDMQLQCYRMVQEALTNIEKHAKASEVSVTLRINGDTLFIFVTDDGTGFDPAKYAEGLGIRGMYDRMSMLGGTLSFQTEPGEGVMVRMEVPLGG
jgi:signal transduction histidine kinase